jgi:phage-related minor tail protein
MTVLLQQGGQLKDMFGGVGNAAKALGGYVASLVTPFTVAAAAIGGIGYAAYAGSTEMDEFKKNLILTGNISGITAGTIFLITSLTLVIRVSIILCHPPW